VDDFLETLMTFLTKRSRKTICKENLHPAAVLVPFFEKEGERHLLLTRRSDGVQRHRGEIAFPGGRRESQDTDLFETALRECREEIGLDPAVVRKIGALDDLETVTGFCVSPFVGLIPYPYPFRLNPEEIKGLIEVPLQFLLNPENGRHRTILFREKPRDVFSYVYQGHDIWGATAAMIKGLVGIIREIGSSTNTSSFKKRSQEDHFGI
jgi:8-oxo-dGTP pyrophosphatase MutT (NUDIX family)